jgi:hypothetical protein
MIHNPTHSHRCHVESSMDASGIQLHNTYNIRKHLSALYEAFSSGELYEGKGV